ncbi:MAG: hypothetical protein U5R49_10220 [Deltaproteobacteria bacterium]|nr:hypothetical protein [Deltaproteobacteria bacterium]
MYSSIKVYQTAITLHQSLISRGFVNTLKWIYYGYFKANNFIVFYKNLTQPSPAGSTNTYVKCIRASLDTLRAIRGKEKETLPVEFYADTVHHLSTPYLAFLDDNVAAIHWLVYPGEESRFLTLLEGDVEINYNTVLKEYRGRRIAESLMCFMINACQEEGQKRMFGVVHVSNIPQYKPMLRLGFEPVEVLTHFGLSRPKASLKYIEKPGQE